MDIFTQSENVEGQWWKVNAMNVVPLLEELIITSAREIETLVTFSIELINPTFYPMMNEENLLNYSITVKLAN